MVERKLSDPASREYWKRIDAITKEVDALPNWMKGGAPGQDQASTATSKASAPARRDKPEK